MKIIQKGLIATGVNVINARMILVENHLQSNKYKEQIMGQKLSEEITIRLTPSQKKKIEAMANLYNQKPETFIREAALDALMEAE